MTPVARHAQIGAEPNERATPDILQASGIHQAFDSHRRLRDVAVSLPAGQVSVLMGANGAGKSTLVRILSGVHRPDAGRMLLDGRAFAPRTPLEARAAGIVTVHQGIDEGVVPDLDVAANLMLEQLADGRGGFWYRSAAARARARTIAAHFEQRPLWWRCRRSRCWSGSFWSAPRTGA